MSVAIGAWRAAYIWAGIRPLATVGILPIPLRGGLGLAAPSCLSIGRGASELGGSRKRIKPPRPRTWARRQPRRVRPTPVGPRGRPVLRVVWRRSAQWGAEPRPPRAATPKGARARLTPSEAEGPSGVAASLRAPVGRNGREGVGGG